MPITALPRLLAKLAGLCLVSSPIAGQATAIRPGVDTLSIWLLRGADTLAAGVIIDNLTIVPHDSGARFVRVYTTRSRILPNSVDTVVDRIVGLRPIRSVAVRGDSVYRLDFEPTRVHGDLVTGVAGRRPVDMALPEGTVNGASIDLLLRGSLLGIGDSLHVTAFTPTILGGLARIAIRVSGEEEIEKRRTWRLVGVFPPAQRVTFWIDQETRAMVRQQMELPTGIVVLLDHRPAPVERIQRRAT